MTAALLWTVDIEIDETIGDEELHDEVQLVASRAIQRGEGRGELEDWSFGP